MDFPLSHYIARIAKSALRPWARHPPWILTANAESIIRELLNDLSKAFDRQGSVAIHKTAHVETGAIIKGPAIVGAQSSIATGAYLRGGAWVDRNCTLGPGVELKSSFLFTGSALAHFNFVGDSILGADVNLEAGSILANHRNEQNGAEVRVVYQCSSRATGMVKFGALIGDHGRVGANAVLAPGTLLERFAVVERLSLVDQEKGYRA